MSLRPVIVALVLGLSTLSACQCGEVPGDALFACGADGACPEGRTCVDGLCVAAGELGACDPESNEAFCARLGKDCGALSAADNCDADRTASCGTCAEGELCGGGGIPNVCAACEDASDEVLCARDGVACGEATAIDFCDVPRTVQCGGCPAGGVCLMNACCLPESDAKLCAANAWTCGAATTVDRCDLSRAVQCGPCGAGQSCTAANVCDPCTPESAESLCLRYGNNCGAFTGADNCGATRTVDCGSCGGTLECGVDGRPNVCGCEEGGCGCLELLTSCAADVQCCSGTCHPATQLCCMPEGAVCADDAYCCAGSCVAGICTG